MSDLRILIVDDETICVKVLERLLSPVGDCDCFNDPEQAVEAVHNALTNNLHYDLICLDLIMPKLGGMEALGLIRRLEENYNIKREDRAKVFIVTTNFNSMSVLMHIDNWDAYLVKPIEKAELFERLAAVGIDTTIAEPAGIE